MNIQTDIKGTRIDPFFLVYKSRSGSTYLANILTGHPDIGIAAESSFIRSLWKWSRYGSKKIANKEQLGEVLDLLYSEPQFATWHLSRESLLGQLLPALPLAINDVARQIMFMKCRQWHPNCLVWGMKGAGWYAQNISVLRFLFPQAKFIHIVRDGRAVFASSKKGTFPGTGLPFEIDPIQSSIRWKIVVSEFNKWVQSDFALEVQYENLLMEPDDVLKKILVFLGLNMEESVIDEMMKPHRSFDIHASHSHLHPNVGKAPQLSRIDAWREDLTQDEVRKFERIAGRTLIKKGYPLIHCRSLWDDVYMISQEGSTKLNVIIKAYLKTLLVKYAHIKQA